VFLYMLQMQKYNVHSTSELQLLQPIEVVTLTSFQEPEEKGREALSNYHFLHTYMSPHTAEHRPCACTPWPGTSRYILQERQTPRPEFSDRFDSIADYGWGLVFISDY
jgi:hypothetical protein